MCIGMLSIEDDFFNFYLWQGQLSLATTHVKTQVQTWYDTQHLIYLHLISLNIEIFKQ